ncbi:MAG TPA: hypothetical protein VI976_01095 [Candidatus Omnitrophota bacterium]|nr:hypothetical protein [Candidatus Omnitrophota bacterium]
MSKQRVSLFYRVIHWFTYHPWLKIIALILACLTWLYVKDEIGTMIK